MSKVIKSFSLDIETVHILEQYCQQEDTSFGGTKMISRSKLVNDAIQWFLRGDTAELVHSRDMLVERIRKMNVQLDSVDEELTESKRIDLPWWRRLLLGR